MLFASVLWVSLLLSGHARADVQVSVRGYLDIGVRKYELSGERHKDVIAGIGARGDAMFGWPRPRSFRMGPAFELRTMSLDSLEAAAGLGMLVPITADWPLGLYGMIGPVVRKGDALHDGFVGSGTVTWGIRSYNHQSWYGYAINLFFSGRKQLNQDIVEFTGGVEVDLMFLTVIPALAIMNFIKSGDPYE
jgi:hypothetical protein